MHLRLFYLFALICFVRTTDQATYSCDSDAPCGCSEYPVNSYARIVNGEDAGFRTWSWAVSLNIGGYICGGTIIDSSYIVTAAHCLDHDIRPSDIMIYAGTLVINGGFTRTASRIYSHPAYNKALHTNDIALLKMNVPLDLSSSDFAKICLPKVAPPSGEYPPPGTSLMTVGWGTLYEGATSASRILQQVTVQAVGSQTTFCQSVIKDPKLQFCAGIMPEGGKGKCRLSCRYCGW